MAESGRAPPELRGLVLTGGFSRRMGRDKGLIEYAGASSVARAFEVLKQVCGEAFVSLRGEQASQPGYVGYPQIVDSTGFSAPVAGLLSAWRIEPDTAWLALAADMPLVDDVLLQSLVSLRSPDSLATAFINDDGIAEPLCAIWEPRAAPILERRAAEGRLSLRESLERHGASLVPCAAPERLRSVDTPEARAEIDRASSR